MRLLDAHGTAMSEFDTRMHRVRADQWDSPTPCTEWSVRDLINHLVSEQLWVPHLLAGQTLDEVGDRYDGDQLDDDPVGAWTRASAEARRAWVKPEATTREVYVTGGRIPATDYGWQMTLDLTVHAWDLSRGIGVDGTLDAELVKAVYETFAPHIDSLQGLGIFAPPTPVSAGADRETRLLAMLGRTP